MSAANQIIAPRLFLYERWPNVSRQRELGHTPEEARELVRTFKSRGADGVKVSKGPGHFPDVIEAICDEARKQGMRGVMVDLKVSETDAVVAANAGVRSLEHYYGVPDAAIPGSQHFPPEYNYWDEVDRFRWSGQLWQEAEQHPENLEKVINTMIEKKMNWDPTMVAVRAEPRRDARTAPRLARQLRYSPASGRRGSRTPPHMAHFTPTGRHRTRSTGSGTSPSGRNTSRCSSIAAASSR